VAPGPAILRRLRKICLALPETREVEAWGHPNFRAGKKTFAVWEKYRGEWCIAVKVDDDRRTALLADPRFYVTPYIGVQGWLSMKVEGGVDWRLVKDLVVWSYRQVALKRMLDALDGRGGGKRSKPSKRGLFGFRPGQS
jgi:predicted DNA-binding protein (MmcQ/YjbR family)